MTRIVTHRLVIRAVVHADAEPNARLWSDPEVMRHMGGPRSYQAILEHTPEVVASQAHQATGIWSVVERATSQPIGNCGLVEKDVQGQTEWELVYLFFPTVWGRGYATEAALAVQQHALCRLGLARVVALIDPANVASERVAVRIGMQYQGDTLRAGGKRMRLYLAEATAVPGPAAITT
jgi:RimJ/RimL family protein N-acetyltransferase